MFWTLLVLAACAMYRWYFRHAERTAGGYVAAVFSAVASVGLSLFLFHSVYV